MNETQEALAQGLDAMEKLERFKTEFPQQSTHQVKLEDTAKGIRISVHVYATSADAAVSQAFKVYQMCQTEADLRKIQLAPIEVLKK